MSEQQAILVIQIHERARQGRLRAQFMMEIKTMKDKSKPVPVEVRENGETKSLSLSAALLIQKIWRGYITRRQTRNRKLQEMLLIGMVPHPKKQKPEKDKSLETEQRRRNLQIERQIRYEKAVKECRDRLEKEKREVVLEQLGDQVREWIHEYKAHTGKIPEYTGPERTSSRLQLSRQGGHHSKTF